MIGIVLLAGFGMGTGVVLAVAGVVGVGPRVGPMVWARQVDRATRQAMGCALAGALVVGLWTRWPVAALVGGAAGWIARSAVVPSASKRMLARLEGVATWIELLRDNVAGHRELFGAIEATLGSCPPSVAEPVAELVISVRSGIAPEQALRRLADALEEPAADAAVASLILATRHGGRNLTELLGSAAAHTREQIALWRRTEVARAKPRREMRWVMATTALFVATMLVVARGYLAPFGTPTGQMALFVAALLFVAGYLAMHRLARPQPRPRLFGGR